MSLVLLIVFIVAMLLWVISLFTDLPAPWSKAAQVCAFIAVLCLFLMIHPVLR